MGPRLLVGLRALERAPSSAARAPLSMLKDLLDDLRRHDSVLWRRAVRAGVTYGPEAFVRYSPPIIGLVVAAALPEKRDLVRRNLRLALGERGAIREAVDVARVFANYASCLTDTFIVGARGGRVAARCFGEQHLLDAAAGGRGMILATAHTGGWEVAGPFLGREHGHEMLLVMRRERDARAQELQDMVRGRAGVRVIHVGGDALEALPLLAHLRKGGVCAMQMDRLPQGMRGRKGELFGEPWSIPEGPIRLAAVSEAPIVPLFTRRVGYMEYEVHAAAPIRVPKRPSDADLDGAAARILREMEGFVRDNPTQWFHFE